MILGANCLYELATAEEQALCISHAAEALKPGGYLCLDNDHMEGDLDPAWQKLGVTSKTFPTGVCTDGTRVQSTLETIWFDAPQRLARFRRCTTVTFPDGQAVERADIQR